MIPGLGRIIMDGAAAIGTWPALAFLMLLCVLFFGYLVPKAKAPIFADVATDLPRKVLDEYVPGWTPQIADRFFADIGPDGRAAYRRFYLTMDFWFPGATASLAIASFMLIAFPPTSGWAWLGAIAAPSWLFDVAENITHFQMSRSYPNLPPLAVRFGPWFTRAKWVSAIVPLPIALVGLGFPLLQGRHV
jgi:hypothetical protein